MIHSVMPLQVANWLLSTRKESEENNGCKEETSHFVGKGEIDDPNNYRGIALMSCPLKILTAIINNRIVTHTFHLLPNEQHGFRRPKMENVSILYADIVGFTKMSSNKTAEHLVGLLNDLFGRFDLLCSENGCEKIATLGDCYYCVSGCPEPQLHHANCCVELGLGMIKTIKEFDEDTNEQVDMRVGVHTGTVLCGIVGTCRFKFDVWSNDVGFANIMESTGKPGLVHISEVTYNFIKDNYFVEEGEILNDAGFLMLDMKTYFITERKTVLPLFIPQEFPSNQLDGNKSTCEGGPKINILSSQDDFQKNPFSESEELKAEQKLMLYNENKVKPTMQNLPGQTVVSLSQTALNYINSRKDSGIRSDHSSLPDASIHLSLIENMAMSKFLTDENLHTREICGHRVSGYYTSSLPSVAEIQRTSLTVPHSFCDAENHSNRDSFSVDPSLTFNESLVRARNLRKQSDLQKLRTVTEKYNELKKIVIMQVENYKKIKDYINDKEMADIFVERKERENAMIVHVREDTDLNIDEVRNYITTDAPNVKKDQFSLRKMGKEGIALLKCWIHIDCEIFGDLYIIDEPINKSVSWL
ncbi:Adenylate cyclase type 9 [Nymphon striatum]|nr:Adenylate cyclase type 9 [Nymphon striatum]